MQFSRNEKRILRLLNIRDDGGKYYLSITQVASRASVCRHTVRNLIARLAAEQAHASSTPDVSGTAVNDGSNRHDVR